MFIHENYVLCSNKDVTVTDPLWELQASAVPGSLLLDCPCATGTRVAAPPSGDWQLCEPWEQGLQAPCSRPKRRVSYRAGPTWVFKDSQSQIHVTGNSGFGGLVCLKAFSGTNTTGSWSACKTILALGTWSISGSWLANKTLEQYFLELDYLWR